ncbi:hypothetical protein BG452_10075 [Streptomyces sp. CBMA123]|nr:hypothetical protein [Streptomyces sp. CBMA123]
MAGLSTTGRCEAPARAAGAADLPHRGLGGPQTVRTVVAAVAPFGMAPLAAVGGLTTGAFAAGSAAGSRLPCR